MKSYITHSVAVYGGIFNDAIHRWPSLRASLEMDMSYLRRAVESRGLPFLTVVLPSMGKVFDRSLDQGCLLSDDIPQGYPKERSGPKFLKGLFAKVFDESKMLRDDACVDAVAFIRQILYMAKKLRIECTDLIKMETLDEFIEIDTGLPPIEADTWGSENPKWQERHGHPLWGDQVSCKADLFNRGGPSSAFSSHTWDSLRITCRRIISEIGEPDWWNISPQHGPGAVSESGKEFSKYEFPNWSKRLEKMFPYDWFGSGLLYSATAPGLYELGNYRFGSGDYSKVTPMPRELPSKLHMVLKDYNGPRLICAEPISHVWIQQGIWKWLEGRMRSTFIGRSITLRDQQNSRNRALSSSLDGKLATIDLSSASDRLSARLVEYVFQGSPLLDGFNACRTQYVRQDFTKEREEYLALRKFSTQGSSLTMPVQSLVYLILTIWAIKVQRGTVWDATDIPELCREVTVYGDDIIAPVDSFETIKLVLHECGLKVNTYKSYGGNGAFRESCGIQAFRGYDVTYVRILLPYDDSPSAMATTVEVSNNLFMRGYWHAAKVVMDQIPTKEIKRLRITGPADGEFGLKSFCGSNDTHLKKVYDKGLQRLYSISLAVTSKVTKVRGRLSADLTQYFTEQPSPELFWEAGRVSRVKLRKRLTRVEVKPSVDRT